MYCEVVPLKQFRADAGVLTYSLPENLTTSVKTTAQATPKNPVAILETAQTAPAALEATQATPLSPGHLVTVPLGRATTPGIITKITSKKPAFPTKPITSVIDPVPLPPHLLASLFWLSEYYFNPLPAVASLLLPSGVEKSRRPLKTPAKSPKNPSKKPTQKQLSTSIIPNFSNFVNHNQEIPSNSPANLKNSLKIPLNSAQKQALIPLQTPSSATKLLHGVTGSGKTNIYLTLALDALQHQKSVILLVPEIALTSQLVQIFEQTFGPVVTLLHSRQTEATRHRLWLDLLHSTYDYQRTGVDDIASSQRFGGGGKAVSLRRPQVTTEDKRGLPVTTGQPDAVAENSLPAPAPPLPRIIIGPRSALLAPLHNLGLIIIDEAHESTFYQDTTPRYSALRLASFITNYLNKHKVAPPATPSEQNPYFAKTILGTATPLATDYYLAHSQNSLVPLTQKAKSTATPPTIKIIDLKSRQNFQKNRYFSDPLLAQIRKNLKNHHQTLIFHNRRGSAPLTLCTACGWQALCPACFLPLTLHTDAYQLLCHTCGYTTQVPPSCPSCGQLEVIHKGFGTKLLEKELNSLFPEAKIARFDADNTKNTTLDAQYDLVKSGEIDLLIGTQAVTKGLDLPHLATVGVVQADAGLSLPDFAAEERTFHLLTQVIGRVGRGHLSEASCFIQTYRPDHPVIKFATTADYPAFYNYIIKQRKKQNFPPFTYLAKLSLTYKTEPTVLKNIQKLHSLLCSAILASRLTSPVQISAPAPAFHEHTPSGFTWQIVLKSPSRARLAALLRSLPPNKNLHITLDPPSLL